MALKRIKKQLKDLKDEGNPLFDAQPIDQNNLFEWKAIIQGPEDSPYKNGSFILSVNFPIDYPFKPMKIRFLTRIFHPNINEYGSISIDVLMQCWSPVLTLSKILQTIRSILEDPDPDNPMCPEIARLYKTSINQYNKQAIEYTLKYAVGNQL